jgi:hypothetical protein
MGISAVIRAKATHRKVGDVWVARYRASLLFDQRFVFLVVWSYFSADVLKY